MFWIYPISQLSNDPGLPCLASPHPSPSPSPQAVPCIIGRTKMIKWRLYGSRKRRSLVCLWSVFARSLVCLCSVLARSYVLMIAFYSVVLIFWDSKSVKVNFLTHLKLESLLFDPKAWTFASQCLIDWSSQALSSHERLGSLARLVTSFEILTQAHLCNCNLWLGWDYW